MDNNIASKLSILYVDDEPTYCKLFSRLMDDRGDCHIYTAYSGDEALKIISGKKVDVIFTDLIMPNMDGIELIFKIQQHYPEIYIIVLTCLDSASKAVKALKAGAYDYILKPLDADMINDRIENISRLKAQMEATELSGGIQFGRIIGRSSTMLELFKQIKQVACTDTTVLICGESGTGKELIAEEIHARSRRKDKAFIRVNCAALPENLINSTLFGYEKGAFTGAVTRKLGLFEAASRGTIFLDEIGDIPHQTQVALLRVLEQRSFQRVGGTESIDVDVRIICATNKDLGAAVREKSFREDLFYRINVVSLTSPPLRERQSDIPLLSGYFLKKYNAEAGKNIASLDSSAMTVLCSYRWHGNVRELSNTIEHAVVFCNEQTISQSNLPKNLTHAENDSISVVLRKSSLESAEETLIRTVLEQKNWNLSKTAEALNIARGTLYSKLQKLGIKKPS